MLVPRSYADRMRYGDAADPLLLQVLPRADEDRIVSGFVADPVHDADARRAPGLLQKYHGRVLLIAAGTCAVHCRYCFRRSYPYQAEPHRPDEWQPALDVIRDDTSVHEVILSGGDPLMLGDDRLNSLIRRVAQIRHVARLRMHTRLPIVLPNRVQETLIEVLASSRLTTIVVVHANHANEIVSDCRLALRRLVRSGLTVLNQAVLLRDINDSTREQYRLCEALIDVGVIPYYLHRLDPVAGAARFEVPTETGRTVVRELRNRLPGYAVPRFVAEIAGQPSKTLHDRPAVDDQ